MVCEGTLRRCVCVYRRFYTHVTTGPITLPGSSKRSLITSFKIISFKNAHTVEAAKEVMIRGKIHKTDL